MAGRAAYPAATPNRKLMGIRSKVAMLPAAVRAEVDRLIVERAFSGYQALAGKLQVRGYRISDDSLQRYGVRLRYQLDALNLARCQAQVLATAGKNTGDIVDTSIAITARQIQQLVLSILPQAAESQEPSGRTNTGSPTGNGDGNAACFGQMGKESGGNTAPILASGEMNILSLHDLVRISDMRVHLNRLRRAASKRDVQLSDQAPAVPANQVPSQLDVKKLCQKLHDAIQTTLLGGHGFATATAQPLATAIEQQNRAAGVGSPEAGLSPAQTHHSPVEAQLSPAEPAQPHLTAPHRASPHIVAPGWCGAG
jgi:hypothetical protein